MLLKATLGVIGAIQVVLGVVLLVPGLAVTVLDLEPAPGWTDWLLVMFAARALGFGYGMFIAARDPAAHRSWIGAMVGVQLVDWIGTIGYLIGGQVTLAQVTTAAFLPLVFVVILLARFPHRPASRELPQESHR
ncbi:MAG: hypothetical protein KDC23_06525 [Actinobacteria bacterium]|nr:hypothetical protein [Actinomycetota bacterium]